MSFAMRKLEDGRLVAVDEPYLYRCNLAIDRQHAQPDGMVSAQVSHHRLSMKRGCGSAGFQDDR